MNDQPSYRYLELDVVPTVRHRARWALLIGGVAFVVIFLVALVASRALAS